MFFETIEQVEHPRSFYSMGGDKCILYYHLLPGSFGLASNEIGLLRFFLESFNADEQKLYTPALKKIGGVLLIDGGQQRLWLICPFGIKKDQDDGVKHTYGHLATKQFFEKLILDCRRHEIENTTQTTTSLLASSVGEEEIQTQQQLKQRFFTSMPSSMKQMFYQMFLGNPVAADGQNHNILSFDSNLGRYILNNKAGLGSHINKDESSVESTQKKQAWVVYIRNNMIGNHSTSTRKDVYSTLKRLYKLPLIFRADTHAFHQVFDKILAIGTDGERLEETAADKSTDNQEQEVFFKHIPKAPAYLNQNYQYFDMSALLIKHLSDKSNKQAESVYANNLEKQEEENSKALVLHKQIMANKAAGHDDIFLIQVCQIADIALAGSLLEFSKNHMAWLDIGNQLSITGYRNFQQAIVHFYDRTHSIDDYIKSNRWSYGKRQDFYLDVVIVSVLMGLLKTLSEHSHIVMTEASPLMLVVAKILGTKINAFAFSIKAKGEFDYYNELVEEGTQASTLKKIDALNPTLSNIRTLYCDSGLNRHDSMVYFGIITPKPSPIIEIPFVYKKEDTTLHGMDEHRYSTITVNQSSVFEMILAVNLQLKDGMNTAKSGLFICYDIDADTKEALFIWLQVYYQHIYIADLSSVLVGKDSTIVLFTQPKSLPESTEEIEQRIKSIGKQHKNILHHLEELQKIDKHDGVISTHDELKEWAGRILLGYKAMELNSLIEKMMEITPIHDDIDLEPAVAKQLLISQGGDTIPLLGQTADILTIQDQDIAGETVNEPLVSQNTPLRTNPTSSLLNIQNFDNDGNKDNDYMQNYSSQDDAPDWSEYDNKDKEEYDEQTPNDQDEPTEGQDNEYDENNHQANHAEDIGDNTEETVNQHSAEKNFGERLTEESISESIKSSPTMQSFGNGQSESFDENGFDEDDKNKSNFNAKDGRGKEKTFLDSTNDSNKQQNTSFSQQGGLDD